MRPTAAERFLPTCSPLIQQASLYLSQGKRDEVSDLIEKLYPLLDPEPTVEKPTTTLRQIARSLLAVAQLCKAIGYPNDARDLLECALCRLSEMLQAEPEDRQLKVELATCFNHLAMLEEDEKNFPLAEEYYTSALQLRSNVYYRDEDSIPDEAENMVYLGGVFSNLGHFLMEQGRKDEAKGKFDTAITFLQASIKSAPVSLDDAEFQEYMQQWVRHYDQPHPMRMAVSILQNAQAGMKTLSEQA